MITGGARAIDRATVQLFVRESARVVSVDRDATALASGVKAANSLNLLSYRPIFGNRLRFAQTVPMKRYATAAEIAKLLLYLASNASSCTTGACYAADAGLLAVLP